MPDALSRYPSLSGSVTRNPQLGDFLRPRFSPLLTGAFFISAFPVGTAEVTGIEKPSRAKTPRTPSSPRVCTCGAGGSDWPNAQQTPYTEVAWLGALLRLCARPVVFRLSMGLIPVMADTDIHHQWHRQFGGLAHQLAYATSNGLDGGSLHLENQFVVHLHDHARAAFPGL